MRSPRMLHTPWRPAWDCAACGEPWPCAAAKAELLAVYDIEDAELRRLLSFSFVKVVDDFRAFGVPRPAEFGERLFDWIAASIVMEQPVVTRGLDA